MFRKHEKGSKRKKYKGIESYKGREKKKDKGATKTPRKKEKHRAYGKKAYERLPKERNLNGSKQK